MQVIISTSLKQTAEAARHFPITPSKDVAELLGNCSTSAWIKVEPQTAVDSVDFLKQTVCNKLESVHARLESGDPLTAVGAIGFMDELFKLIQKYGYH